MGASGTDGWLHGMHFWSNQSPMQEKETKMHTKRRNGDNLLLISKRARVRGPIKWESELIVGVPVILKLDKKVIVGGIWETNDD